MATNTNNGFQPIDPFGRHDAVVLAMEADWRYLRDRIHPELPDEQAEILCRSLGEIEKRIAIAQSYTALGVAAKLRIIKFYCTDEGIERPHWLSLLDSAISDLEVV